MQSRFKFIAEELRREIEDSLFRVGLLCRVFARGKDDKALSEKLIREPTKYKTGSKLIQDVIGIRVALYFPEDIDIVKQLLCARYIYDSTSSTIDLPHIDQFTVSRYNLIFKIPQEYSGDLQRVIASMPIDLCFEVQLRSILSEGWHEVEHDLRYKSKSHWEDQDDLIRALNGIVAILETSEWSMRRIFDDLAYRQYKKKNWAAMLHNKLRMRVAPQLSENLIQLFNNQPEVAKEAFRVDRMRVIQTLSRARPRIPVTLDNVVYVWNLIGPKINAITNLTPTLVGEALNP